MVVKRWLSPMPCTRWRRADFLVRIFAHISTQRQMCLAKPPIQQYMSQGVGTEATRYRWLMPAPHILNNAVSRASGYAAPTGMICLDPNREYIVARMRLKLRCVASECSERPGLLPSVLLDKSHVFRSITKGFRKNIEMLLSVLK